MTSSPTTLATLTTVLCAKSAAKGSAITATCYDDPCPGPRQPAPSFAAAESREAESREAELREALREIARGRVNDEMPAPPHGLDSPRPLTQ